MFILDTMLRQWIGMYSWCFHIFLLWHIVLIEFYVEKQKKER